MKNILTPEQYARLFSSAFDVMCITGTDGYFKHVNQAFSKMLGYSESELLARPFIEFIHPDDRQATLDEIAHQLHGEVTIEFENRYTCKDGSERWLSWRAEFDTESNTICGIAHDITERKLAEDTLRSSEIFLRGIFDNAAEGIWVIDTDKKTVRANHVMIDMLATTEADIRGTPIFEFVDAKNALIFSERSDKTQKAGIGQNYEIRLTSRKGRLIDCLFNSSPLRDNRGHITGSFALVTDITDRKMTEYALLAAKIEAERADIAKSRFLAAASHDLRQPLQAITLFSDALDRTELSKEQKRISDNLCLSVQNLGDLLEALLDISKLDAGNVKSCLEPIQAAPLFARIESEFALMATAKSLRFKLSFPLKDLVIFSDGKLLLSLLGNLIGNAIKYTEQGGILVAIRRRNNEAVIQVWDTGIGIQPEHMSSIFDEYFQAGNPERDRAKGLGLGLSIVQRVARLLNTEVVCHSKFGKGSVFEFRLPIASAGLYETSKLIVPIPAETDVKIEATSCHIVVIDDDVMVTTAIQFALEAPSIRISTFGSAETALASPEITNADFYISDLRLPGLNGAQFLDAIQQRAPRPIKALLLTGDLTPLEISDSRNPGWAMLYKPVNQSELMSAMTSQGMELGLGRAVSKTKPKK